MIVDTSKITAEIMFQDKLMPCCGKPIKFYIGPTGGCSENIKCSHCGQKFNICPPYFIEKI